MTLLVLASDVRAFELIPALARQFPGPRPVVVAENLQALRAFNADTPRIAGEAARLPFTKGSFAAVASIGALQAARWPWTVLAELQRVLIPNGKLRLFEPVKRGFFCTRNFSAEEAQYRLARAGFEIQGVEEKLRLAKLPGRFYCLTAVKR